MKLQKQVTISLVLALSIFGCETSKGTGAIAGAGVGALVGAAAGDTQGAIIGAAVGVGVGYIIGDQVDKRKAKEMSAQGDTHTEVGDLGGTQWRLDHLNTTRTIEPYASKVVNFLPNGRVVTTTTSPTGALAIFDESYRVVGDTLIVNKPGYLVNAKYKIEANQLIISDPGFSAVFTRVPG